MGGGAATATDGCVPPAGGGDVVLVSAEGAGVNDGVGGDAGTAGAGVGAVAPAGGEASGVVCARLGCAILAASKIDAAKVLMSFFLF